MKSRLSSFPEPAGKIKSATARSATANGSGVLRGQKPEVLPNALFYCSFATTTDALCPPKPRVLDIATLTVISRATLGT